MDDKYIKKCHARLKELGLPIDGWYCCYVFDVAEEGYEDELFTCELCGCSRVRFVHVMEHQDVDEELSVGCICAGIMEGDIDAAKGRERDMKNRAVRKQKFPYRNWRVTRTGNLVLNHKNGTVFINRCQGNKKQFWVYFEGNKYYSYRGKPIMSFETACMVAFDAVDPVGRY